jgi:predicted MFS family arabinose efflux permease
MKQSLSSSRTVAWTIWMIASVFYAYQYILRVMPNIMLEEIMGQFHIGAATFGQFSGVYYIGYSLLHLPIGILLDRYGPRKVMSGCILLTVIGLSPLIFAEHWVYPVIGRILIGLGSSAAILGVFKIIRMTFQEARFARMLSITVMVGLLGAIYGGGPVSIMRDLLGYQTVIQMFAILGIALSVATYWIVPDVKSTSQSSVWADVKEVINNRKLIGMCLCAGLMVGPLEGFADVWGTAFLKQAYGFEGTLAASLPSMIFIGMCFGSPVLNFIAEKVGSYLATIVAAGIIMVICFSSLLVAQLPSAILTVSFVMIGVCCAYQILAIYKASTYAREHVAGLSTALANMIIMIFGYAFHSLIGGIVNAFGGPSNLQALIMGVSVIPIALAFGTLGFGLLFALERKEKLPIPQKNLPPANR